MWSYIASGHKVAHWTKEKNSNTTTNKSVEPLPEKDVFEAINIHALVLIDIDVLGAFLVLLELDLPLSLIHWRQNPVWLPSHHWQSALGQSGIASNPNDGENRGTDRCEPSSNHLFFASCHKLFTLDVENDWIMCNIVTFRPAICTEITIPCSLFLDKGRSNIFLPTLLSFTQKATLSKHFLFLTPQLLMLSTGNKINKRYQISLLS